MSANGAVLELTGIVKTFAEPAGELRVLDGLSLRVRTGEIVLLQGPSGSGKTTLLQIAGTMLRADAGTIHVGGVEVNGAPDDARAVTRRRHLGFVFQHFHLVEALTAWENVALGLRLKRLPVEARRVDEVLEWVGLTGKKDKLPRDLSGGEKQRVAFARALVGKPSLLLADEPTSQLDAHAAESLAGLVRRLVRESGSAALIATHDTRLHPIADRIGKLKEGRLDET